LIAKTGETEEGEFKIDGASGSENPQVFTIDEMEIVCTRAREQGTLIAPSAELEAQLEPKDCTTEVRDGALVSHAKVAVKGPVSFLYGALGKMRATSPITFDIKALKCELTLSPATSFPGPVAYLNESVSTTRLSRFPSGFQHKLKVSGKAVFFASETTPGSCPEIENLENDGGAGAGNAGLAIYSGAIFDEARGADLGFEEEEELPGGWNKVKNIE